MVTDRSRDQIDPEKLELRARPRPVTRISRKVLFTGSGLILCVLAGTVFVALDPPDWKGVPGKELLQTRRASAPDGLEQLPSSYDGLPRRDPTRSGERAKTVPATAGNAGIIRLPDRPHSIRAFDPDAESKRAEQKWHARKAVQATEADLFFTVRLKRTVAEPAASRTGEPTVPTSSEPDLANLTALTGSSRPGTRGAVSRANQNAKLAFLQEGPDSSIYNPLGEQKPASPYQLLAGTVIPASLVTGLNSDLPGLVIAQVTENVFDSVAGKHLLVPQGTRLIGKYDSVVAFRQRRALVVWQRIIRPDGSSVVIDNLPATDTAGYAGLTDEVDFHTWQIIKGIALSTLLGVTTELSLGSDESDLIRAIRESTQENANRAGQGIVSRMLDIQPTITVRPGWPLRVIVNKDIVLSPYESGGG
ncbi:MAG: conjugal transfer protein TraI [Hyphomicrobiaceae bacterium]|nr:conjugal transfer protein TraI [Hyphomicrobiaceae bacterium]